jgi:hypothetical protein
MKDSLRFAVCQFPVTGNMDANLRYILRYENGEFLEE